MAAEYERYAEEIVKRVTVITGSVLHIYGRYGIKWRY